jgi:hypothetical protein
MSSGLRKLGAITTLFPACPTESQRKNRGSVNPTPGESAPSRLVLCKKRGATRPIAPKVTSYVTKRLPAVTSAVAASATVIITPRHRLGFIDGQSAAIELRAVQGLDGFLCLAP